MRIRLTILAIFISMTAIAQGLDDLEPRSVEPSRTILTPYHNLASALANDAAASRFRAPLAEFVRSTEGATVRYTSHFVKPVSWLNRQQLVRVDFCDTAYRLYVNGREVGYSPSGVLPCEFNITKATVEGRNEIAIVADGASRSNRLYCSAAKGLGTVEVLCPPTIRLRDISAQVRMNEVGDAVAEFAMPVKCDALNRKSAVFHYTLRLNDTILLAEGYRDMALAMRGEDSVRFACVVPKSALWSTAAPTMVRLDVESRIDNRIAECVSRKIALRELSQRKGALYVNGERVKLNMVEYSALSSLDEVAKYGYNTVILTYDKGADAVIAECERRGIYVVVRTPIDTTALGDNIRRGGNPSNDPLWGGLYIALNDRTLHLTKGYGAVVGYAIAKGKTTGVNIYDTYLYMKQNGDARLVIYEGAGGEWCSDKIEK
ncbi:MAG: hypothetical protein E7147_01910 [Rikenellaceae bacterium]|nr:hypothetical protein [Rikenellaceae bacterium]